MNSTVLSRNNNSVCMRQLVCIKCIKPQVRSLILKQTNIFQKTSESVVKKHFFTVTDISHNHLDNILHHFLDKFPPLWCNENK